VKQLLFDADDAPSFMSHNICRLIN
jgi:hypothetical protein